MSLGSSEEEAEEWLEKLSELQVAAAKSARALRSVKPPAAVQELYASLLTTLKAVYELTVKLRVELSSELAEEQELPRP